MRDIATTLITLGGVMMLGLVTDLLARHTPLPRVTLLLRMAPGASLPDHEHVRIEQTYVLEGRLVDPDGTCTEGNFVWRPAGTRHAAYTPEGGLMLAMFQAPNKFFERDGSVKDMLDRDWEEFWGTATNLEAQR